MKYSSITRQYAACHALGCWWYLTWHKWRGVWANKTVIPFAGTEYKVCVGFLTFELEK